jgi:hypothetical protein
MPGVAQLVAPVCSITITKRRRFFWAAWWTAPPRRVPFCKPDASNGGASTREEAFADAVRAAGRSLVLIEPDWARAWIRILRGQPPWVSASRARSPSLVDREEANAHAHANANANASEAAHASANEPGGGPAEPVSIWSVLGAPPNATEAELKLAFRSRALETHPDHGGDPEAFRRLVRAYAEARRRVRRPRRRR